MTPEIGRSPYSLLGVVGGSIELADRKEVVGWRILSYRKSRWTHFWRRKPDLNAFSGGRAENFLRFRDLGGDLTGNSARSNVDFRGFYFLT